MTRLSNGGNSRRAQARIRSTFAPWWAPWAWCWTFTHAHDLWPMRCALRRGHFGRHAVASGFGVQYFDGPRDGTP